jgi:hypothetical protein
VIFYKDFDISYSNQNTIYGTFPCVGPHRAGFIVTGAWSTYYTSTGTYNVNGDSLTYSWAFEGGTPTGSTAKDPGLVRYTTPGHYKTRFITTSSSGAIDTRYCYVSAYQKPSQGTFNPIEAWELSELSGSRAEGGYTARIKIMSILPDIQPKALIVIFADDTFGGNIVSLGSNSPNQESIVFVGYVLQDSIKFNYEQSTMEFDVGSVTELMKEVEGFSVSCESKASATTWYELTEMTVQKALYHYLRWHSTVLNVTDFQYTGDDRLVQYFDSDRESLFDAIDNFMRNSLLGAMVSDRQGKLWSEISHFGLQTPFTTIPTNPLNPNKQDWMNDPTIQERRGYGTSFVELGGIAYYGTATNTFSALISDAPGLTPLYRGKTERQEGLILVSQQQLNQVAANYLAYHNTQFPEVNLPINGNYRNIDIAPQEKFYLVVSPSDTIRNISLQDKPYTPTSMTWRYDSVHQTFVPELTLEQMATGTMSESVNIPITPPYVDSGFDYPSLQLPTFPVFNPPSQSGPATPTRVLLHDTTAGLIYTENFDAINPQYITVNAGLTATQYQNLTFMGVCPNGAVYVAFLDDAAGSFIARAPFIGGVFTVMSLPQDYAMAIAINPLVSEQIGFFTANNGSADATFHVGTATSFNTGVVVPGSNFWFPASLSFGDNSWMITSNDQFYKINAAGTSTISSGVTSSQPNHIRAGTTAIIYTTDTPDRFIITRDSFATTSIANSGNSISIMNLSVGIWYRNMSIDPTGQFLMTYGLAGHKARSSDFGSTWVAIPNLPPGVQWCFAYAGANGTAPRFIAANAVIRFTPDFGNTWVEKGGNITGINPFPNINYVIALGI